MAGTVRSPPEAPRPSSEEIERSRRIGERIRQRADSDGFVRFDRFMEEALYAPDLGFYTHPGARIGPAGAFYTAVHASPLFGRAVAARVGQEFERLGRPDDLVIVEAGAGDGVLAESVLEGAGEWLPKGHSITYRLVERSPRRASEALDRLEAAASGVPFEVRLSYGVGEDGPFRGVVLANELLDALPARRWVRRRIGWVEHGVKSVGDRWEWADGPIATERERAALPEAPEGCIVETQQSAHAVVREIADHLEAGAAVLFDYGAEEPELLAGWPRGSVAAVRGHRSDVDPLEAPGSADLSSFVNFSRLRNAIERSGMRTVADRPQPEALVSWGLEEMARRREASIPDAAEKVRSHLGVKNLLFGFSRFRVLELSPRPPS